MSIFLNDVYRFIFYQLCSVRCPKAPHRSQKSRIPCLAAPMRSQNPYIIHGKHTRIPWNILTPFFSQIFRDISVAGNNPGAGGTYPPSPSTSLQGCFKLDLAICGRPSAEVSTGSKTTAAVSLAAVCCCSMISGSPGWSPTSSHQWNNIAMGCHPETIGNPQTAQTSIIRFKHVYGCPIRQVPTAKCLKGFVTCTASSCSTAHWAWSGWLQRVSASTWKRWWSMMLHLKEGWKHVDASDSK